MDPTTYSPSPADVVAWTINTYDASGNLIVAKQVRGFTSQIGPPVEFTYDAQGLNVTTITRRGVKNTPGVVETDSATPAYDALSRVTAGVRADWYPTQFVYDAV